MNLLNLLVAEQLDSLTGAFQALGEIVAGFVDIQRGQTDNMNIASLLTRSGRSKTPHRFAIGKQEYPRCKAAGFSDFTQHADGRRLKQFGIINDQIELNAYQLALLRLLQQTGHIALFGIERLTKLGQQGRLRRVLTRRQYNTLNGILVTAGNQRLAQQRLAGTLRPRYHQHLVAITSEMVQLGKNRLSFRRKELEAWSPRGKGIVTELVMLQQLVRLTHRTENLIKTITHCSLSCRHSRSAKTS